MAKSDYSKLNKALEGKPHAYGEKRVRRAYHDCSMHEPGCKIHQHPETPEICNCAARFVEDLSASGSPLTVQQVYEYLGNILARYPEIGKERFVTKSYTSSDEGDSGPTFFRTWKIEYEPLDHAVSII